MEKNFIDFDIKLKNEICDVSHPDRKYKVQTKRGETAEILKWDTNDDYPIVVLLGNLYVQRYTEKGTLGGVMTDSDLILIDTQEEMTDFQKQIKKAIEQYGGKVTDSDDFIDDCLNIKWFAFLEEEKEGRDILKKGLTHEEFEEFVRLYKECATMLPLDDKETTNEYYKRGAKKVFYEAQRLMALKVARKYATIVMDNYFKGIEAGKELERKRFADEMKAAGKICMFNSDVEDLKKDYTEFGKNLILGKIPNWKIAEHNLFTDTIDYAVICHHDGGDHEDYETVEVTNRVMQGERYIELEDLKKLIQED